MTIYDDHERILLNQEAQFAESDSGQKDSYREFANLKCCFISSNNILCNVGISQ